MLDTSTLYFSKLPPCDGHNQTAHCHSKKERNQQTMSHINPSMISGQLLMFERCKPGAEKNRLKQKWIEQHLGSLSLLNGYNWEYTQWLIPLNPTIPLPMVISYHFCWPCEEQGNPSALLVTQARAGMQKLRHPWQEQQKTSRWQCLHNVYPLVN